MIGPGRILIIGAGPCSLGAAFRLDELGHEDFTVYERAEEAGGLVLGENEPTLAT